MWPLGRPITEVILPFTRNAAFRLPIPFLDNSCTEIPLQVAAELAA
jgi:hypothetical protein